MSETMPPGLSVVTLGVTDLDRSERFYLDGLGLEPVQPPQTVRYFKLGGIRLALFPRDRLAPYAGVAPTASAGFAGMTLSCNVASRPEVDRLVTRAEAAGATVTIPPRGARWGGYYAWLADPDGYLWEIIWNPRWNR